MVHFRKLLGSGVICLGVFAAMPAQAQSALDFYRGKTITILVSTAAGGEYDLRARLIARHIGKFIPGDPSLTPRNMLGGGGVTALNWMAAVAPQDGTVMMTSVQTIPTRQAVGNDSMKFDMRHFSWIGNTSSSQNVITSWANTGITTIEEARRKELVLAATSVDSGTYYYPIALNTFTGTKFKVVTGYPGGNEMNLAMERGEVGGRGSQSWDGWKTTKPDWVADKKIAILAQVGLERHPDLPNVMLMQEMATTAEGKAVLRFLSADTAIARPLISTANLPSDRLAALRKAFDSMMRDKDYLAESDKQKLEMTHMSGEKVHEIVKSILDAPPAVLSKAKEILERR